jgi:hypothetical protein
MLADTSVSRLSTIVRIGSGIVPSCCWSWAAQASSLSGVGRLLTTEVRPAMRGGTTTKTIPSRMPTASSSAMSAASQRGRNASSRFATGTIAYAITAPTTKGARAGHDASASQSATPSTPAPSTPRASA